MPLNPDLLSILACPTCHTGVTLTKKGRTESLKCKKCRRVYPVKNGIPIMLPQK